MYDLCNVWNQLGFQYALHFCYILFLIKLLLSGHTMFVLVGMYTIFHVLEWLLRYCHVAHMWWNHGDMHITAGGICSHWWYYLIFVNIRLNELPVMDQRHCSSSQKGWIPVQYGIYVKIGDPSCSAQILNQQPHRRLQLVWFKQSDTVLIQLKMERYHSASLKCNHHRKLLKPLEQAFWIEPHTLS